MYYNYGAINASYLPYFGGDYGNSAGAGAFFLFATISAADSYAVIGGRLMFL